MPTKTTTRSARTATASPKDRVKAYCKKQGFAALGGKRVVLVQAYYALRELLGQQLQSQAYLSKNKQANLDWGTWNKSAFDQMIGGNPVTAAADTLDAIGEAMTEIASFYLAPHFSKEVNACLKELAAKNLESVQSRNNARRDQAALAEAVTQAMGATDSLEADDDLSDEDDDDFTTLDDDESEDDLDDEEAAEASESEDDLDDDDLDD
ncbi:hypothetical protein GFS31_41430 (plasmid) [Leptolyngbya sp. BL0902]|uniref:hypothetical protein n=1 Tax=Leptolyngbya sp. BL0902 TaxID=1115757 RepID=UPI0018E8A444|nr:hypothetical protein [Leptolyngbya sp. BL0902]QQE67430.1 hypothetical protein GFS31_41430 [Leptolyngbya sp. BL0902]